MTSIIPQPVPQSLNYDLAAYPAEIHPLLITIHNAREVLGEKITGGSLVFSVTVTCTANPLKAPKVDFVLVHSDYSCTPGHQDATGVDIYDSTQELLRRRHRDVQMSRLADLRSSKV
jgi:hypothetical protein